MVEKKEEVDDMVKIGDELELIPQYCHKRINAPKKKFTVVAVDMWESNGPPSAENHGTLSLEQDPSGLHSIVMSSIKHYCLFNWQKSFRKINKPDKETEERKQWEMQVYEEK